MIRKSEIRNRKSERMPKAETRRRLASDDANNVGQASCLPGERFSARVGFGPEANRVNCIHSQSLHELTVRFIFIPSPLHGTDSQGLTRLPGRQDARPTLRRTLRSSACIHLRTSEFGFLLGFRIRNSDFVQPC